MYLSEKASGFQSYFLLVTKRDANLFDNNICKEKRKNEYGKRDAFRKSALSV